MADTVKRTATLVSIGFISALFFLQASHVFADTLEDIHNSRDTSTVNAQSTLTLGAVVSNVIGLINIIIPVLFTLALIFFFWACIRYIMQAGGEGGGGEVRGQIVWGLIALVVIFSIWGLVNLLCVTFLGTSCSG